MCWTIEAWIWDCGPGYLDSCVFMCLGDRGAVFLQLRLKQPFTEKVKGERIGLVFHTSITFTAHGSEGLHLEHLVLLHSETVVKVTSLKLQATCILVGNHESCNFLIVFIWFMYKELGSPFCVWIIRCRLVKEIREYFLPKGIWNQFYSILKLKYSLTYQNVENVISNFLTAQAHNLMRLFFSI